MALSTTKKEFMANNKAMKEGIWLQGLVKELGFHQNPTKIYCDGQSVVHLIKIIFIKVNQRTLMLEYTL